MREQGVSFDVYLRGLIEPKRTDSEENDHLSPQERVRLLREWESSHNTNSRFFLMMQSVAKASTEGVAGVLPAGYEHNHQQDRFSLIGEQPDSNASTRHVSCLRFPPLAERWPERPQQHCVLRQARRPGTVSELQFQGYLDGARLAGLIDGI